MKSAAVHQLVHGYKRGHQLLAGSTRLPSPDDDLVTQLSDLSGTLIDQDSFPPYLTTYPVSRGDYYALAKTWLDSTAQRAGCVLTHTLLIPVEDWASCTDPLIYKSLLTDPSTVELDSFRSPVNVDLRADDRSLKLRTPPRTTALSYVSKYFGDGTTPVVWIAEDDAEDIAWLVLRSLWHRLRQRFACCAYCLKPRTLRDRPFDLMFAPAAAYSRFSRFDHDNFVDVSKAEQSIDSSSATSEPWYESWTDQVFGFGHSSSLSRELLALASQLSADPTDIRRVFLIDELNSRIEQSPEAAVGVLDVVESVAPQCDSAADYKRGAVVRAVQAAQRAADEEGIRCLALIGTRLERPAFACMNAEHEFEFVEAVSCRTQQNPDTVLEYSAAFFARAAAQQAPASPFTRGVLEGLLRLANQSADDLQILRRYPDEAATIIALEPRIAAGFLRGLKESTAEAVRHDLAAWISSVRDLEVRDRIRTAILPEITSRDAPIIAEILRELSPSSIGLVLDQLAESTHSFKNEAVKSVVEEQVSRPHPNEMRHWLRLRDRWTHELTSVMAATYPANESGLRDLLDSSWLPAPVWAAVGARFLREHAPTHLPQWIRTEVEQSPALLAQLLAGGPNMEPPIETEVSRLLEQVRTIPIAKSKDLASRIEESRQCAFYDELRDASMRSVISGFVSGDISASARDHWQSMDWSTDWLSSTQKWTLVSALTHNTSHGPAFVRAWDWLACAPRSVLKRRRPFLHDLIGDLIVAARSEWPPAATDSWVTVLKRADEHASPEARLQLHAQALQFAFVHATYPLSSVIAHTFASVHKGALKKDDRSDIDRLFDVFGWDKAKQLRKNLVAYYMESHWPPGDMAFAAREPLLLRRIFKRAMKRRQGESYVAAMLQDLGGRKDEQAAALHDELQSMARNPRFYEEWI